MPEPETDDVVVRYRARGWDRVGEWHFTLFHGRDKYVEFLQRWVADFDIEELDDPPAEAKIDG